MKNVRTQTKRSLSILLAFVMLLCAVPVMQTSAVNIPAEAVKFGNHYYQVFDESISWTDSKAYCESLGGHLVTITSAEEQEFVYGIVENKTKNLYWLGGNDVEQEGEWKWITGEPWNYTNWSQGNESIGSPVKPDNFYDEDYLTMFRPETPANPAGTWNDEQVAGDTGGSEFYLLKNIGFVCEWDGQMFPDGYNFETDSFSFTNPSTSWALNEKYFTTVYELEPGKRLCEQRADASKHGLCHGVACVTANIFNNRPSVSSFKSSVLGTARNSISELDLSDKTEFANGLELSLSDYIKYAFVHQYSCEALSDATVSHSRALEIINNNQLDAIVKFRRYKTDENGEILLNENGDSILQFGHAVLLVGYADNGRIMYIDDPNNTNNEKLESLVTLDDGSWVYSSKKIDKATITSKNSDYLLYGNCSKIYSCLLTGTKATVRDEILPNARTAVETETYIDCDTRLSQDKVLCYVDSSKASISAQDYVKVESGAAAQTGEESIEDDLLFWIDDDEIITFSNLEKEENEMFVSGDNTTIKACAPKSSEVTLSLAGEKKATIQAKNNSEVSVSFLQMNDDEKEESIRIQGLTSDLPVNAAQTETGLTVTGLNNMTITYSVNDEVVSETTVPVTDGREVNITVDETSNAVTTDFHTHTYTPADTTPATCSQKGVRTFTCACGDSYTQEIGIDSTNHVNTKNVSAAAANCKDHGYTAGVYCNDCEQYISGHKDLGLDPNNHAALDKNGNCPRCGKHVKDVTQPTTQQTNPCKYCGQTHTGFPGVLVGLLHWLLALLGFKK